jgi:hypothetical protein
MSEHLRNHRIQPRFFYRCYGGDGENALGSRSIQIEKGGLFSEKGLLSP